MSSGFNSDVHVGEQVFHVQTEDRGPARPILDTVVYQNGMVLCRRSSNYETFAASAEFTPEALRHRVEVQHRQVIEDLRSGALAAEVAVAREKAQEKARQKAQQIANDEAAASAIQIQLLNPDSWLTAGTVSLDLAILTPRRSAAQGRSASGSHDRRGASRGTPCGNFGRPGTPSEFNFHFRRSAKAIWPS